MAEHLEWIQLTEESGRMLLMIHLTGGGAGVSIRKGAPSGEVIALLDRLAEKLANGVKEREGQP